MHIFHKQETSLTNLWRCCWCVNLTVRWNLVSPFLCSFAIVQDFHPQKCIRCIENLPFHFLSAFVCIFLRIMQFVAHDMGDFLVQFWLAALMWQGAMVQILYEWERLALLFIFPTQWNNPKIILFSSNTNRLSRNWEAFMNRTGFSNFQHLRR